MQHQASRRAQDFARTLRRGMTDAEQAVWRGLRSEQLGVKFRRQHPQGPFIADFACLSPRLIVEIDGGQHAGQQAYDQRRDEFFKSLGFEVLRFHANEALSHTEGVLLVVLERLQLLQAAAAPIPAFPQRGKGLESSVLPAVAPGPAFPGGVKELELGALPGAAPIPVFPQRGKGLESGISPAVVPGPAFAPGVNALQANDPPARLDAGSSSLLPPLGEGRDGGCLR